MKEYCFLIDTSGDKSIMNILPDDTYVMPFTIIINDGKNEKTYNDWFDIDTPDIEKALSAGYDVKTSQTPYGKLFDKVQELLKQYKRIACLTITKDFSGTYNTFLNIKKEIEENKENKDRLLVVDTKSIGYLQCEVAKVVKEGLDLNKSNNDIEKAVKILNDSLSGFTTITNATQLIKGGRLRGMKALLVKALHLKLVIKYRNGKLEFYDKATNVVSAIDKGIESIDKELNFKKNPPEKIIIATDFDPNSEETKKLINYTEMKLSVYENAKFIKDFPLPTAVVSHLGAHYFSILIYCNHKPFYQ